MNAAQVFSEPLELREQRYRLLVDSVEDYAIFSLDARGVIDTWNTGAERIKGYTASEIIGQHFSRLYRAEDVSAGKPQAELEIAARTGRYSDEGWRVRKDGTLFWASVVINALRDPRDGHLRGFAKVTRDLTEWKSRDDALRANEEALAATLYSIGDGVIATDELGRVTRLNPVAERLTGWTQAEARGRDLGEVFQIIHEETRAPVESPVRQVLEQGRMVALANHTALIARDGTERPIADSGAPIRDASGRIRGAVLVFRDTTEERRAREERRILEERFRLLVSQVRDYAIFLLDPQGRISSWNAGAERLKGYTEREVLGRHFSMFYPPEEIANRKPDRQLELALNHGRAEDEGWRVRKDGSRFWANVVVTALRGADGTLIGFAKVTRDLTERRETTLRLLEEQAARAATEAARKRSAFLADMGRALAEARDAKAAVQRIARLALPMLGDYCIIDLRAPDGSAEDLAVAHVDPGQEELVASLRRLQPVSSDPSHPTPRVLRTGKAEIARYITDDMFVAAARSAEYLETLRRLHPTSSMVLPMFAGERPTGTISFVSTRSDRHYDDIDLSLAEDLAHRLSLVVENARLYEAEQRARRFAEESQARLASILEQLPAGVILAEAPSGRVVLANREYQRIFGSFPEAIGARTDGATLLAKGGRRYAASELPLARAIATGETVIDEEICVSRPPQPPCWISVNAGPIRNPAGDVVAGVAAFYDVTERKRAVESLEMLAQAGAILGSSLEHTATLQQLASIVVPSLADWCSVHLLTEEGRIVYAAVAHSDPAKVERGRVLREEYPVRPDEPHGVANVLRTGKSELYTNITEEMVRAVAVDERHAQLLLEIGFSAVLIVPLHVHGRSIGTLTAVQAESGRSFQSADVALLEELARRAAVAVENARLYLDSQRAVELRDEFVSIASHELKTPLTSLSLHVEGLLRSVQRGAPLDAGRSLQKLVAVRHQVARQERLIDELLDFSRIAAGRLELHVDEFDLVQLVKEVLERFEEDAEKRQCALELHAAGPIIGSWDRSRLEQVVTNLLTNALKYAPGKPIEVRLREAGEQVTLEFSDHGPGIAARDHERIFRRFERAVSRRNYGGFGLGLWLVREIVSRFGGAVAVASELGHGATFTVVLPRHVGPQSDRSAADPASPPQRDRAERG